MKNMKYGILKWTPTMGEYQNPKYARFNIGDYLQTKVIRNLYKEVFDIDEEEIVEIGINELKEYSANGADKVLLPLHLGISYSQIERIFPLSGDIIPVWWGITMNIDIFRENKELVKVFKYYEPIAVRDEKTKEIMLKYGIESYVVGCITLTMNRRKNSGRKTYFVDIPSELEKYIPQEIRQDSEYLTHEIQIERYPIDDVEYKRLADKSMEYYKIYEENAALIVTSRLHAAVPALAMGIPVIVAIKNADDRFSWLDKYIPIYQSGEYHKINWQGEQYELEWVKNKLKETFFEYCNNGSKKIELLKELDHWYMDRKRIQYNKEIDDKIKGNSVLQNTKKNYIIYGGGIHAYIVYDIMKKRYPHVKLSAVVDRYEENETILGVPVVRPDFLSSYKEDFCIITTFSGREEAEQRLCELGQKIDKDYILCFSKG